METYLNKFVTRERKRFLRQKHKLFINKIVRNRMLTRSELTHNLITFYSVNESEAQSIFEELFDTKLLKFDFDTSTYKYYVSSHEFAVDVDHPEVIDFFNVLLLYGDFQIGYLDTGYNYIFIEKNLESKGNFILGKKKSSLQIFLTSGDDKKGGLTPLLNDLDIKTEESEFYLSIVFSSNLVAETLQQNYIPLDETSYVSNNEFLISFKSLNSIEVDYYKFLENGLQTLRETKKFSYINNQYTLKV